MCSATTSVGEDTWLGPPGAADTHACTQLAAGGRDVRPAHPGVGSAQQRADEVVEPVGIGHAVAIGVGKNLARRGARADVARVGQAHVLLAHRDEFGLVPELIDDLRRAVGRAVVHQHDLVVGIVDLHQRAEAGFQRLRAVVGADDDAHLRVGRQADLAGDVFVVAAAPFFPERTEGELGHPLAGDQAERPVRDVHAAGEPFVGPRVDDRPRQPAAHDALDVPGEHVSLFLLGMADRVHAELAHDAGLVVGEVLQAQEVVFKVALVVQVDVEGAEIDVLRQEVFRGRIARVGIQRGGVDVRARD